MEISDLYLAGVRELLKKSLGRETWREINFPRYDNSIFRAMFSRVAVPRHIFARGQDEISRSSAK